MKKATRIAAGLLALGLCAFAAGCGPEQKADGGSQASLIEKVGNAPVKADFAPVTEIKEGRKNVYAVLKVIKGDYWSEVVRGLKEGGEAAGCNVYMGGALREMDWQTQKELLDELKDKKADAVILAPSDSVHLIPAAKELQNKKTPLILVDTVLNSEDHAACFVSNNFEAGEKAAQEMLRLLRDSGLKGTEKATIAIKVSSMSSHTLVERVEGVSSYWAANAPANWKLSDKTLVDFGDSGLSQKLGEEAIKNIADLKGFIVCNNRSTVSAIEAIKAANRKDLALVGFDYAKETREMIASPEMNAATVVQNQYEMAFDGVKAAVEALEGRQVEDHVYKDTRVVNKSNYKEFEAGLKK